MFLCALLVVLPALAIGQHGHHGVHSLKPYDATATTLFNVMDADGNGDIDHQEMHAYFDRYDANQNGQISVSEFNQEIDAESSHFKGHEGQMFHFLDVDVNHHLTETDFLHVFQINDFNNDNHVSMHEFVTYWEKVFEALEGA